jgi:hypothetical protein
MLKTFGNLSKMPITYTIQRDQNLIEEVWMGEIRVADLAEYWKRYLGDREVLEIRRTIVDLREAVILFKGAELDYLIQTIVHPVLVGRDWKTAIVVDNSLQYGTGRQYQVFAERYSKDAIFEKIEEARQWMSGSDSHESEGTQASD